MSQSRKGDYHALDLLAGDLNKELASHLKAVQQQLSAQVPIGERRLSPEEKFKRYMNMAPEERDYVRATLGDRWGQYEAEQLRFVVGRIGPAARFLLPYIAPTMAAALEVDNADSEEPF